MSDEKPVTPRREYTPEEVESFVQSVGMEMLQNEVEGGARFTKELVPLMSQLTKTAQKAQVIQVERESSENMRDLVKEYISMRESGEVSPTTPKAQTRERPIIEGELEEFDLLPGETSVEEEELDSATFFEDEDNLSK